MTTNIQKPNPTSFEELLEGMTTKGKYDYLRIILSKNDNRTLGQKYLMATKHNFGLVKLLAVDFQENFIQMDFEDVTTGMVKQINFDVEDQEFKFMLVSWSDIKKMVLAENTNIPDDKLLDFDY